MRPRYSLNKPAVAPGSRHFLARLSCGSGLTGGEATASAIHDLDSQVILMSDGDNQDPEAPLEPANADDTMREFAGSMVRRLSAVALSLESARSIVGSGPAGDRIAAATDEVDRLICDLRTAMFPPSPPARNPRAALINERMVRTARRLQEDALNAAALLERQADHGRQPTRLDYQAETKRWKDFAARAGQVVERCESYRNPN
jgi:hypothetical protein